MGNKTDVPSLIGYILFGSFIVAFGLLLAIPTFDSMGIMALGIALVFGKFLIYDSALKLYAMSQVGRSDMQIRPFSVAVGGTLTINYEHTFKSDTELTDWTVTLLFTETATYKQGTKTKTVRHTVEKDSFSILEITGTASFYKDETITEQITLTIPNDAMHSLDVWRNKLEWQVAYNIYPVGLKPVIGKQTVEVLPQIIDNEVYKQ